MSAPAPLRPVDARPVEAHGAAAIAVHDPLGVCAERLVFDPETWAVACAFDGAKSADELAREAGPTLARTMAAADVEELARKLSAQGLLADAAFERERDRQLALYRALPARPAVGAGVDYAADPTDLRIQIGGLVANDWDMPPAAGVCAALAPACSFARAGELYARAYAALRHERPQRIVLLTPSPASTSPGHDAPLIVPSPLDLDTSLGRVVCDAEAVAALGVTRGPDELAHRTALALERHALFLRVVHRGVPVVPLVCTALPPGAGDGSAPWARPGEVERAVAALGRVAALQGPTLWLCAADLAPARGPSRDAARMRAIDRAVVDAAIALDPQAFWRAGQAEPDPRRAAWSTPLLLLLLHLRASAAHLTGATLGYRQVEAESGRIGTASLVFHTPTQRNQPQRT